MKTNNAWLFLVLGPLKVLSQLISLWLVLGYSTKPAKWMLVQVSSNAFHLKDCPRYILFDFRGSVHHNYLNMVISHMFL